MWAWAWASLGKGKADSNSSPARLGVSRLARSSHQSSRTTVRDPATVEVRFAVPDTRGSRRHAQRLPHARCPLRLGARHQEAALRQFLFALGDPRTVTARIELSLSPLFGVAGEGADHDLREPKNLRRVPLFFLGAPVNPRLSAIAAGTRVRRLQNRPAGRTSARVRHRGVRLARHSRLHADTP